MAAVFPVAAGNPIRSGIMIPEIWSPKLLYKFYKATVFGEIANTDYEGEIANKGDTVHIRTTPDLVINDYEDGQALDYQQPEPTTVDLLIDKGKYWAFKDTYVTRVQSDYDYVSDWTDDASIQMRVEIDKQILASIYVDAAAENQGATAGKESSSYNLGVSGTPLQVTKTNVIEVIQDVGSVLDEQDVPEENRSLVVPAWFINRIGKSDLKDASLAGDSVSIARNGRVGMIDRFTIYRSNNMATTVDGANTVTNIIGCQKTALTFASQLIENEGPFKHPNYFGDFYRGLQVYGFNVNKPAAMVWLYAYPG
jgi:hypothetical protein